MSEELQTIHNVGDAQIKVSLYHLIRLIGKQPNTCGQIFLLNTYIKQPSHIEELYCLGVLNYTCNEVRADPKFSYNQTKQLWEYF